MLATNCYRQGPLGDSCFCGHVEVVKELIRCKADVHSRNTEDVTPMIMAAQMGQAECLRELLRNGALTEAPRETDGQTALMWAVNSCKRRGRELLSSKCAECAAILREAGVRRSCLRRVCGDLASVPLKK